MAFLDVLKKNKKRLLMGFLFGVVTLFCVIRGGIPLMLLVGAFIGVGTREYVSIINNKGMYPFLKLILFINYVLLLLVGFNKTEFIPFTIVVGTIAAFLAVIFKGRQPYIANVATTVLGFMFGALPIHVISIRQLNYDGSGIFHFSLNDGLGFIILVFFAILMTDVGAYFFGTRYGKRPLCPVISPKKTIEGAIGGSVAAIVTSMIIGGIIQLEWYHSLVVGVLATAFAQLGDLAESLLKRDAGVKDSGNSIPGHGGFLDRADSYIFSTPVAYYYLYYFVVNPNLFSELVESLRKAANAFGG